MSKNLGVARYYYHSQLVELVSLAPLFDFWIVEWNERTFKWQESSIQDLIQNWLKVLHLWYNGDMLLDVDALLNIVDSLSCK